MKTMYKLLVLGIMLFLFITKVDAIPNLDEIATAFNNNPGIQEMNNDDINMVKGYESLVISDTNPPSTQLEFNFKNNILSTSFSIDNEDALKNLLYSLYLIDSIGTLHGYNYGDLLSTIKENEVVESYTLEKEGLEIRYTQNEATIKVDITKKIPLKDFSNTSIEKDDIPDDFQKIISGNGSAEMSKGNIWFNKSGYDGKNTLLVAEKSNLTQNSYKSILTILEIMFDDTKVVEYFERNYDNISLNKEFNGFKIEINPTKTEFEKFLIPDDSDYKFMRISINKDEAISSSKNININNKTEDIVENPKTGIVNYIVFGITLITVSIISILIMKKNNKFYKI